MEDYGGKSSAQEIRQYIENANADTEETEDSRGEEKLAEITEEDTVSHVNALTVVILAFVMIFFGTLFTALTNYQDFTEGEGFTFSRFFAGKFFSEVEAKFNKSLPLQDYLHNAESAIKYFYGTDNETDFIDIEAKKAADDPYTIEDVNEYIPLPDPEDNYVPVFEQEEKKEITSLVTTDNKKNKKLSGIRITTPYYVSTSAETTYQMTNLDLNGPNITYTTTWSGVTRYRTMTSTTRATTTSMPDLQTGTLPIGAYSTAAGSSDPASAADMSAAETDSDPSAPVTTAPRDSPESDDSSDSQ